METNKLKRAIGEIFTQDGIIFEEILDVQIYNKAISLSGRHTQDTGSYARVKIKNTKRAEQENAEAWEDYNKQWSINKIILRKPWSLNESGEFIETIPGSRLLQYLLEKI